MGRGKRSELTTDDLLRLQEARPTKRIRSTYGDRNSSSSEADLSDNEGIPTSEDGLSSDEGLGERGEGLGDRAQYSTLPRHVQDPVKPTRLNVVQSFSEMGISAPLEAALRRMSIHTPTEIQAACIPPLLSGMLVFHAISGA